MCGIAGILSFDASPEIRVETLRAMSGALQHRGPDDAAEYIDPKQRCGLAFRRLSIIDLTTGRQPLSNETGDVWVMLNGEIYNYRELRAELLQRGHRFASQSDTETIAHLYEDVAERCFERLEGMFAIAIWDARIGRLLLARDRFGKKPIVYRRDAHSLHFASELKAIRAIESAPPQIDPQSIHRYLTFQYVPAPHSIYRECAKLPPGHFLSIDARAGASVEPKAYYSIDGTSPNSERRANSREQGGSPSSADYDSAKTRLGELLTRAVEKRLIADVPLGAFLSGGIDSSIVVALMRKLGVSPLRTFSIGFNDPRYDERRYARLIADRFQTEHHEHIVTPDARQIVDKLAYHYDEPFADSSAIPTWYVSHFARHSVTVALTGDAGDELFGGYDRYRAAQLAANLDFLPNPLRNALSRLAGSRPPAKAKTFRSRAYRFLNPLRHTGGRRYARWMMIFTPEILAGAYRPEFLEQLDADEPLRWFDAIYDHQPGEIIDRVTRTDILTYLPGDLLTKVDIASMAVSLECRAPFLDRELVEFALGLPGGWRTGKRILKDWVRELLPAEVLSRPKMGFGVPVGEWMRRELRDVLEQRLLAPDALCSRIFREDWLRGFISAHVSGATNHEHPLWALLMLEFWRQRWGGDLPA